MYKLQILNVSEKEGNRNDTNPTADGWDIIAEGKTHFDILDELLTMLNDDAVNVSGSFFRMITPENNVLTF